jgi:uncharacterized protein (UPF0332 family)
MSYSKEDLVRYRIERAREAFADTEYLVAESRWNAAANRMYYTCFYVVSAYLALKNLNAITHSGLKSAFNLELVKTGRVSRDDGILFNRLFSMRQQADYEDFMDLQEEDILPLLPKIMHLIREIEDIIIEEQNL